MESTAWFRRLAVGGLDTRIRVRDGGMRGKEGLNDLYKRPGFLEGLADGLRNVCMNSVPHRPRSLNLL